MTEIITDHYMRSDVRDVILKYCSADNGLRCLNSDERWYASGQNPENVRLRGPADYEDTVKRGRTLYATLNLFQPGVFQQEEKWLEDKNAPATPIGTNANTFAFTLSADIDGIGDIKNLSVKEAVEDAGQFYVDFFKKNGISKSVHSLYSGGGIYVHLHHKMVEIDVENCKDTAQTSYEITTIGKAFNLLIGHISREFFRQYGEHIGKVKFDQLNNQKRTFKTIFSIHKRLPYAVIPLDNENIKISFVRASLPLSDGVIEDGKKWYDGFDPDEKTALGELLRPYVEEVMANESATYAGGNETISRKVEPIAREDFPPCIKNIIQKAEDKEGKHRALGVLATYLYQAGWDREEAHALWEEVADRCAVADRIFETEWGRVCCPNCDTMKKNTGGYPSLNLFGMGMCYSDPGCLGKHWPGEYDASKMTVAPEVQIVPIPKSKNNQGNVEWLVELHGHDLKYIREFKDWVRWTGVKWQRDETAINRALKDVVRTLGNVAQLISDNSDRESAYKFASQCGNNAVYAATAALASTDPNFSVSVLDFDENPWVLNMKNGVLDLKTYTMRKHNAGDRFLKVVKYDFDPAATCPGWIKFLNETYGGDQTLISYFQRVVGRALTGSNSDKAFFFLFGAEGNNGKSKIAEILRAMLDEYAYHAAIETFMKARGDKGVREDLVPLFGMRLITSSEPEEGMRFELGLIKIITGEDPINCRELYGKRIVFTATCKLFFIANNRPAITERSEAAWSRVHVIPHEISVPEERQDKNLAKKLKKELPGILNWALDGLKDYNTLGGLKPPEKVVKAVKAYRVENDTVQQFVEEVCTIGASCTITGPDLYEAYKQFCIDSGRKSLGLVKFNGVMLDAMVLRGVIRNKEDTGYIWNGITAPNARDRYLAKLRRD